MTKEAQLIFDALAKMFVQRRHRCVVLIWPHRYSVVWEGQSIVVERRVRIRMPYTDDFFERLIKDVQDAEILRLQKVVGCFCSSLYLMLASRLQVNNVRIKMASASAL